MLKPRWKTTEELTERFQIGLRRWLLFEEEAVESFPADIDCIYSGPSHAMDCVSVHLYPRKAPFTNAETVAVLDWAKGLPRALSEVTVGVGEEGDIYYIVRINREGSQGAYIIDVWIHDADKLHHVITSETVQSNKYDITPKVA